VVNLLSINNCIPENSGWISLERLRGGGSFSQEKVNPGSGRKSIRSADASEAHHRLHFPFRTSGDEKRAVMPVPGTRSGQDAVRYPGMRKGCLFE